MPGGIGATHGASIEETASADLIFPALPLVYC
jgi:hypothetical protein